MHPKVKGLVESFQAYIERHPDCEVTLAISRLFDENSRPMTEYGMKWELTVNREPSEL